MRELKEDYKVIADLFQTGAGEMGGHSILRTITPAVHAMQEFVTQIGGEAAIKSVEITGNIINKMHNSLKYVTATDIRGIAEKLNAAVTAFGGIEDVWTRQAVQPLVQVIQTMQYLEDQIGQARIVDMNVLLGKVGEALGITEEEITVSPGNVEVRIDLKIKLEAEELSKILVQGEYVAKGKRFDADLELIDR
jgi:hypothetical protein